MHYLNRWVIPLFGDNLLACSDVAAHWMYGKGRALSRVKFAKNGILIDQFLFDQQRREIIRQELGLNNQQIAVGAIARLEKQKNIKFMVDILGKLQENHVDAVLVLVGTGTMEQEIKNYVGQNGLSDCVKFLGLRSDIADILFGLDVYLMPSLYEGLPFSGIEAQAAGLPILCSTFVSDQLKISDLVHYLPLTDSTEIWAKKAIDLSNILRVDTSQEISKAGFNIYGTTQMLERIYRGD